MTCKAKRPLLVMAEGATEWEGLRVTTVTPTTDLSDGATSFDEYVQLQPGARCCRRIR